MADPQKPGFLSGYKGNLLQRLGRAGADWILPGNQRGADGTLTGVGRGLLGLGLKVGATAIGGPALGQLVGKAYGNYSDTGSVLPAFMQGGQIGPVTRQQIGFPGQVAVGNVGMQQGYQPGSIPTMPSVQAQAPWTGSLAGSNPFGGSYGSNLGFSANAPRSYGRAAGSFTPNGAGAIQVAGNGWAGSDAAAGFGLGAQGAGASSAGSIALSDAIAANKRMRY